jgi:outer membrane protein assembly factor BamB
MIVGAILAVSAISGGIVYWVWSALAKSETGRYQTAMEQFNDKQYSKAETTFALLVSEFPESERAAEYKFRHLLSQALRPAFDLGKDSSETFADLQEFVRKNQSDPLFKPNTRPIGEAFNQIAKTLTSDARSSTTTSEAFSRARRKLKEARQAGSFANQFGFTANPSAEEEYAAIESAIAKAEKRLSVLEELRSLTASAGDIGRAEKIVVQNGLAADPEAKDIVHGLKEAFRANISYVPTDRPSPPPKAVPAGLVIVSKKSTAIPTGSVANGVVFAIARGVLYALSQSDGEFLWATRVGIDTTTLPVHVPAIETIPELVLISSSGDPAISAHEISTGQLRWRQPLSEACAGKPVLIARRAYVPTHDGRVHEIEVDSGRVLGSFELRSPLAPGAVHEVGTDLLYVPGSSACVYVLDVKQRQCVNVLQTGHPTGSLRCPLIAARPDAGAGEPGHTGYLVLCQADGPWSTKLRAFPLSSNSASASESTESEPVVRGWPWFEPACDGEKITLATDAGMFGLYGINQPRNQDTPLFRILQEDPSFAENANRTDAERAQVVYARDRDFWILIAGRLRHVQLAMDRNTGVKLLESWSHTTPLGHPVQSGQIDATGERLFLVSQSRNSDQFIASAIEATSGKVLWQRRLGLTWRDGLIPFHGGVLALDRHSGLYAFDPSQTGGAGGELYASGSLLAAANGERRDGPAFLLESPDGKTASVVLGSEGGTSVAIWRYERNLAPVVQNVLLRSPLLGTPALGADYLLLPLADGSLLRQPFDGKSSRSGTWRSSGADRKSAGSVLHLGPGEFITTDGSRGISRWTWAADSNSPKEEATIQAGGRVTGTPALLPPGLPGSERFVAIAESAGTIRLLKASDLSTVRSWNVSGKITDGPYVLGAQLACVADGKRLIGMDPTQDALWEYLSDKHPIVGRPQIVKDIVVVADRGGRLVGLDPMTGKSVTPYVPLGVNAPPASAPLPYGEDRLFIPISDGTAILLPLSELRKAE